MKKINRAVAVNLAAIAMMLTASFIFPVCAQQSYTYLFSSTPFNSVPTGGPTLEPIDSTVTPITVTMPVTTCPDSTTIDLTYFQFNAGFKAKAFFTGTYSIEMIFRFEELNGYNRIIDFSNSLSDYGIYTLWDCLNFYPTGNIGLCPGAFDTTNYKQLVITRNDTTKEMKIYVNGALFTTHIDATNYYIIASAPNDSIKFFKDDYIVPNEASTGYVALIRMCDFTLSPQDVITSYNNFCDDITGIDASNMDMGFSIYPNPAKDRLAIQISGIDFSREIKLTITNAIGQKTMQVPIYSDLTSIYIRDIVPGVYFYKLQIENAILKTGKIIIE